MRSHNYLTFKAGLKILNVLDGHFNDLSFFNTTLTLLQNKNGEKCHWVGIGVDDIEASYGYMNLSFTFIISGFSKKGEHSDANIPIFQNYRDAS